MNNILCPSVYKFLTGMLPSDVILSIDEIEDKQTRRGYGGLHRY